MIRGPLIRMFTCAAMLLCFGLRPGRAVAQPLPPTDASGMAWVAGDTFLVVHDAKRPEERDRPRVSLMHLPRTAAGPRWVPLDVAWPEAEGPSHDLESVARVPGTTTFLLAESGDDASAFRRIYVADYVADNAGGTLRVRHVVSWPAPVYNVEGAAVAWVGEALVFLFAERAHGRDGTDVAWAPFTVEPPGFGAFEKVFLPAVDPVGPDARPVSALAVDAAGRLYAASAFDPERDDGPFRSVVWAVGAVEADASGRPRVRLAPRPERLATLDGLKVESLAVRERRPGCVELFAGTDDEFYGAVVRPLPGCR